MKLDDLIQQLIFINVWVSILLLQQITTGNTELHKDWIKVLLVDYYDPMYDFQTDKKLDRIVFRGQKKEVLDYLEERYGIN